MKLQVIFDDPKFPEPGKTLTIEVPDPSYAREWIEAQLRAWGMKNVDFGTILVK